MRGLAEAGLREAYAIAGKQERRDRVAAVKEQVLLAVSPEEAPDLVLAAKAASAFKEAREGRGPLEHPRYEQAHRRARPLDRQADPCEVGILPRTHGSALFTRGETQALAVATLGTGEDEQYVDALQGTYKETFMLHYNFPPYSVGEVGRMSSPGRREIGHGKLAWRAIHPVLPDRENFPYTIRIVSEITSQTALRRWRQCAAPRSR